MIKKLRWKGKFFIISGLKKEGITELARQTMHYLEELKVGSTQGNRASK